MKKEDSVLITQLDYVKILIEEEKYGQASDMIFDVSVVIDSKVKKIYDNLIENNLEIPKILVKTKPNEWKFLNNNWVKFKSINKDNIVLYLNRNNLVQKQYTVNKNLQKEKY